MKIIRFALSESPDQARVGFVDAQAGQILDAAATLHRAGVLLPTVRAVDIVERNTISNGALASQLKDLSRHDVPRWQLDHVVFLPPIEAGSLRDFIAFEQHIKTVRSRRGAEVPPVWYEMPVYYKGNHRTLIGHNQSVRWPRYTEKLDYELELACVIGKQGIDITEEDAPAYIGGYACLNDWSARDIQFREQAVGLGPSKGKDFGTSIGPWLVTPEEFNPQNARMVARINGEVWSDNNIGKIHYSFPKMIAHVSNEETVYPGDILGSGTAGGGCGVELDKWLKPGDMVEIDIEGIGVLRNQVIRRS